MWGMKPGLSGRRLGLVRDCWSSRGDAENRRGDWVMRNGGLHERGVIKRGVVRGEARGRRAERKRFKESRAEGLPLQCKRS